MYIKKISFGIKLGIVIGILSSIWLLYDVIWGPTFFGIQLNEYNDDSYKIQIYEDFQNIRDPQNSNWLSFDRVERYGANVLYLKRNVVVPDYTGKEILNYYHTELTNKKLFEEIKFLNNNTKIYFKSFVREGSIEVVKENPTIINISIGGRW